jgi:TonB family protein
MNCLGRAAVAFMLLGTLGEPAQAEPREPTGPWHVQFDGVQCVALREYGSASEPLTFALKPSPSGGVMRIVVVRKGVGSLNQFGETLRFDNEKVITNALLSSDESGKLRLITTDVPMAQFKSHLGSRAIGLEGASLTATFAITDLQSVVGGLDHCMAQLRDRWSIGDEFASRVVTAALPAKGSLQGVITPNDYPRPALSREQEGTVGLTLLVDVDGRVPDCGVDETSGVPFLDLSSCYFITHRAQFRPAIGRNGQPVRSTYPVKITWRIAL